MDVVFAVVVANSTNTTLSPTSILTNATGSIPDAAYCQLAPPTPLNLGMGLFLIVGILISYIPQMVSIVRSGSSRGLSYFTLSLLLFASFMIFTNAAMLNWDKKLRCCRQAVRSCYCRYASSIFTSVNVFTTNGSAVSVVLLHPTYPSIGTTF